jgi:serine/threonine protein kinase
MSSENDARRREASGAEESSPHSGTSAPTPGIPAPGDVIAGIPAPGDVIAGKYEVERVLGSGGMGVVLAARHRQLGQRVAIKLLRAEAAFEITSAARFLREARSAVALTSEHVTKVLDIGELESGAPFMVMEYLAGVDLAEVHQGIGRQIIRPKASPSNDNATLGAIGCRSRLGGLLNYYCREAA